MRRSTAAVVAATTAAVVLTACADDGPFANGAPPVQNPGGEVLCPPIPGYTGPVAEHGSADVTGSAAEVVAGDSFFESTCVAGVEPGTVTLTVMNTGRSLHNVTIRDQGIDADVLPGETITVDIEVGDEPLVYICKYHRTSGMVGVIIPS